MSSPESVSSPKGLLWAGVLTPALLFYALLTRGYIDIPNADDYPAVLAFANQYVQMHGVWQKLLHIITFQQSEYKTMLVSGITALQCELIHRVSLSMLIILGNLIPIGIFFTVLAMYKRKSSDFQTSLLSLLPISFLLFQLQYSVTLDWATAGMQNLPIILCSLLAILFLSKRDNSRTFTWAIVWLILAICSSANGFGLSIVGGIMLLHQRRSRQLALWILTVLVMGTIYFYKYNFHSSQSLPGATVGQAFLHFNVLYAISFLGTSVAGVTSYIPSVVFGTILLCLFLYIWSSGYYKKNTAVFYSMVFVVASAFGVAGLRGAFGIAQSLASRYRIYSNLMLALVFIYFVEAVLPRFQLKASAEKMLLASISFLCLLFCLGSDWAGLRFIEGRKLALITEMAHWEHAKSAAEIPIYSDNPALERQLRLGIYKPMNDVLSQSIRLHLYTPPVLP